MEGEYSRFYETLHPLGKGAFGFVRIAQKKDDGLMVSKGVVGFYLREAIIQIHFLE